MNTYQGRLQLRVDQVLPLKDDEYDVEDLVFTPENTTDVASAFAQIMESIEAPELKALMASCLRDEDLMEKFNGGAAGKKWHHAFRAGWCSIVMRWRGLRRRCAICFRDWTGTCC